MDQLIIHLSLLVRLLGIEHFQVKPYYWELSREPGAQRAEWHIKDNGLEFEKIIPDHAEENLQQF